MEGGPRSIAGARVIVTGAASGIGRATALLFAQEGAAIAALDLDAAGLRSLAGEAGQILTIQADVSDAASVRDATARAATTLGGIDVLVNNAGISAMIPIDAEDYDAQWDRHVAVLLTAQQRLIRNALPDLRRSEYPRIVNIASTEALGATAGLSAYSAAKAGVVGLTRSLAVELGKEGITVNCICPGPILTGMTAAIPDEQKVAYSARRTALRRYGCPEEIAHMVLSIALPAASFLTGAVIPVDGGLMARNA
ncbi:SDR family oxidoreductase [Sphingomonas sp. CGMCC 1.13654]|uniref:SDR family oxidoreductase n=1 Tax=Sphingomonas chungangi TaxID=2683589 RepID=A0A838L2W5_9SPHN|nr:SDR family NAD(P)-dependent oxidoreductase [Sphingomonas chungangi]MBA2933833.1 SDR family oxidoreductase [Sphingomonas chungangi]MVW55163.1 SDR family oxidoreductase [Sphingomonas chungangi]